DGTAHGATGSCKGVGDAVLAGLNLGASFTNVPGGTANWTFTDVTGNYNNQNGSVNIVINTRPASVTPNDASKLLGALDPVPLTTGTLSGFIPADGVTATYTRTAGETVVGSPYTISATLSPAGMLSNYNITYNAAKFSITYGVCLLFDNSKAVQKNATIPIKLNLCDVNGVNISSSGTVLNATNLVWWGVESAPEVQDSGNANPDDNFRFTGGSYIFNLSTKNLWSGKWGLEFKANGDPLSHVVIFNVK
ncbi:MAG TPA: MBG domain-containing protein, partial [Candidatus Binatia bacterium]|nr:MBG domain-containing protein [Candidatus Binatia bacterium]